MARDRRRARAGPPPPTIPRRSDGRATRAAEPVWRTRRARPATRRARRARSRRGVDLDVLEVAGDRLVPRWELARSRDLTEDVVAVAHAHEVLARPRLALDADEG